MSKEKMMPDGSGTMSKKPEFIPKPEEKPEHLVEFEKKQTELINESGFTKEDFKQIDSACFKAYSKYIPGTGRIDGSIGFFTVQKIEKVSNHEAKVTGEAGIAAQSGIHGIWEMKVIKDGNIWKVEKAVQL